MRKSRKKLLHKILWLFTSTLIIFAGAASYMLYQEFRKLENDDPEVWESVIREFEASDIENPAPRHAVLFIGRSSIRFWKGLEKDMWPVPVINRGFGGAKIRDLIYYSDRIIFPYEPKTIVLFAGTNDITGRPNDKTPHQVFKDFKELTDLLEKKIPGTPLYYLAITPTVKRWDLWPLHKKINQLIEKYSAENELLNFVETDFYFLNANGLPDKNCIWWDGIHLNQTGYQVWTNLMKPVLMNLHSRNYKFLKYSKM
jgi:lysophospholipase L1-like esterase